MAHTIDHPAARRLRPSGRAGTRGALAAYVSTGVGLVVTGGALTLLGARTTNLLVAAVFVVWYVAAIAWADLVQAELPWGLAVGLGLALLLVAAVLPSRSLPSTDVASFVVALASAVGVGLALGPAVGAVERAAAHHRRR